MKVILSSSLMKQVIDTKGHRQPGLLYQKNQLLENLRRIWKKDSKVLIIPGSPVDDFKNEDVLNCYRESFQLSELSVSYMENVDSKHLDRVELIPQMDAIILAGGHVPTQNQLMKDINLKERLKEFKGLVIAWSAGSMNSADVVYSGPELEGEALDPNYQRWLSGLSLTNTNIFPHFQMLKEEKLDGLRILEDITYPDSIGHEIIAMNDGSYILIEEGKEILYGEAYRILDARLELICKDEQFIQLK